MRKCKRSHTCLLHSNLFISDSVHNPWNGWNFNVRKDKEKTLQNHLQGLEIGTPSGVRTISQFFKLLKTGGLKRHPAQVFSKVFSSWLLPLSATCAKFAQVEFSSSSPSLKMFFKCFVTTLLSISNSCPIAFCVSHISPSWTLT